MRKMTEELWVVYNMTVDGPLQGPNAVCEQGEWDEMELRRPGRHVLIRGGIASEAEAERLARESPGGTTPGKVTLKARGAGTADAHRAPSRARK